MTPTPYAHARPQDCLFLALTFVTVMVVVLTSHNAVAALLIIGLMAALVLIAVPRDGHTRHAPRGRPPRYRGAIDIDDYDTELGHRDRGTHENDYAPQGNPFNTSRVGAPRAAGPCLDDEANDDELDGDERLNYQALSRNDPLRATVGAIGRQASLDAYLREEVDEEEGRVWWGRHEI